VVRKCPIAGGISINIHNQGIAMTREQAEQIANASLALLMHNDSILLVNDVSERTITHRLAEHLKPLVDALGVAGLSVDCEYNRNTEEGQYCSKRLRIIENLRESELGCGKATEVVEKKIRECTAYPDIIVHHRGNNQANELIIEVKKENSQVGDEFDKGKLCAFTGDTDGNAYRFRHGVFIKLQTRVLKPKATVLRWFSDGHEDPEQ
jgi:hypothetical protein